MTLQRELFAAEAPIVPGLLLVPDAVTPAEESRLAAQIDAAPLEPFEFGQWRGKRLTAHYGSAYDFARGRLDQAPPLPDWLPLGKPIRASVYPTSTVTDDPATVS